MTASSLRITRSLPAGNVISILGRTLNLVDPRLMNHGFRVAELADMVMALRHYTPKQRRDVAILAILHDIGAYKTEEIDKIVQFETLNVWQHAIYGYVYVKRLTPLDKLAPAIFFHHASREELRHAHPSCRELAQILHIADRLDIMGYGAGKVERSAFLQHFKRNNVYLEELVDSFDHALFGGGKGEPLSVLFGTVGFSESEQRAYLGSLPLSIDFRSPQTVTHTMGVACIADALASLSGQPEPEARRIRMGALLHDLGKQGIPTAILESPGRLDGDEMAIMRTHVKLSEDVLDGNVEPEVMRIAVRHHEKLNGAGYHHGLSGRDLTYAERLVAVADVMSALMGVRSYKDSFPRAKVQSIVESMVRDGGLDGELVALALGNYDRIAGAMLEVCDATVGMYRELHQEYDDLFAVSAQLGQSDWMLDGELEW